MDLSTLQHKLGMSAGGTGYGAPQLLADLVLMCKNAVRFNGRGAPTSVVAEELLEFRCAAAAAACAAAARRMRRAATGWPTDIRSPHLHCPLAGLLALCSIGILEPQLS